MTSESQVPEWQRLQRELAELAWNLKLENVYVMDAWLNRWCSARPSTQRDRANVDAAVKVALDSCSTPLTRGGRLDQAVEVGDDWVFVISFAGIYLLVLQFRPPEGNVTAAVRMRQVRERSVLALPAIEALTLALPPPQGPGSGPAEGFGSA